MKTSALMFLTAAANPLETMRPALVVLIIILAALVISSIVFTFVAIRSGKKGNTATKILLIVMYAAVAICLVCTILCGRQYAITQNKIANSLYLEQFGTTTQDTTENITTQESTVEETEPEPTFTPEYTDQSNPENWGIKWEVIQSGSIVDSYRRDEPISFGKSYEYTALEGITTFRGDNYRSGPTYGTADVVNQTITQKWSSNIGSFNGWPGSGWTGQPLIVRWDAETKAIMNMYDDKKVK